MEEIKVKTHRLINEECFIAMDKLIEEGIRVDAVICDPTFGTTNRLNDITVPFNKYVEVNLGRKMVIMYEDEYLLYVYKEFGCSYTEAKSEFKDRCKLGLWDRLLQLRRDKTTPIILMSNGLNTVDLIESNKKMFKYKWIWNKVLPSGMLNVKRQPLTDYDDVCVFYEKQCVYNRQMTEGRPEHGRGDIKGKEFSGDESNYNGYKICTDNKGRTEKNPTRILNIEADLIQEDIPEELIITISKDHPSIVIHSQQKPALLGEYFVKTYTNEGDTVLDFMTGSGFVIKACNNLNRAGIGIDFGKCEKEKFTDLYGRSWASIICDEINK